MSREPIFTQNDLERRGSSPGAILGRIIAQAPKGMGDTELGAALDELEAMVSPVDPRVVDELLEAGVLQVEPDEDETLEEARARVRRSVTPKFVAGLVRRHLDDPLAGELPDALARHPEVSALLQLWGRRAACPDCGRRRDYTHAAGRVLWLDCAACQRAEEVARWRGWISRCEESWHAEALRQIGEVHWPREVELVSAVSRLLDGEHPSWCAYLHGSTGTGKTQQAAEAIRRVLGARLNRYGLRDAERFGWVVRPYPRVLFTKESELLASLRPGRDEPIERYQHAAFLVIDDLGESKPSSWAYEQLEAVIDYRYRKRRPLLLTSNHDLPTLRQGGLYDERLTSRVFEMCGGMECHQRGELAIEECTTNYRMPRSEEVLW